MGFLLSSGRRAGRAHAKEPRESSADLLVTRAPSVGLLAPLLAWLQHSLGPPSLLSQRVRRPLFFRQVLLHLLLLLLLQLLLLLLRAWHILEARPSKIWLNQE